MAWKVSVFFLTVIILSSFVNDKKIDTFHMEAGAYSQGHTLVSIYVTKFIVILVSY